MKTTSEMVAEARERILRADYEGIRENYPEANLPVWEDMTAEQRAAHEKSYAEMNAYMNRLGDAIASGSPLPSPFGDTDTK